MKTKNELRFMKLMLWTSYGLLFMLFTVLLTGCKTVSAKSAEIIGTEIGGLPFQVHFIDVDQGDSILIKSGEYSMLIDAGENDQGQIVVDYLKQQQITVLDYVIGTHPHSDHIGGLDSVIEAFEVKKVILPPKEHITKTFEDVLEAISEKGLKITKPVAGDEYTLGDAVFTILGPEEDYGDDLNNWSIGVKIIYGSSSFVLCGDAEAKAESDMSRNGMDLSADVLKAGHHGSSTSTTEQFLKAVKPFYALISCGRDNSYGHPDKEIMDRLKSSGIQVFRTDQQGTVIAGSDGTKIVWNTEVSGSSGSAKQSERENDTSAVTENTAPNIMDDTNHVSGEEYILNTNSKKFHNNSCSSVIQIKEANKAYSEETREKLIEKGYSPCKNCNP